ncbi:MAG: VOC family protein [Gemmatimonadetes bacterium]|nr:VOC family protein [Gemmatimonadota bacterium]
MSYSKKATISKQSSPRRSFIKRVLATGAAVSASSAFASRAAADASQARGIVALDHVAIPIQNVEEMVSFYRALGFGVRETGRIISIHFGDQKINFHRPSLWESGTFTLRAAAAQPPCGDFCWVWEGTEAALAEMLERADAEIVAEGERAGGRDGGDAVGQSVYIRDPDGNLLEFIRYS